MPKRTICIGDIHGCLQEFRSLVEALAPTSEDRVVLLGDLLDKGPSPAGVVCFAREIGAETIRGNHEEKALRWFAHEEKRVATGKANPMKQPPAHRLEEWGALSSEDRAWLSSAPTHLDLGSGFLAVHGGLLPGLKVEDHKRDVISRLRFVNEKGKFVPLDDDCEDPQGATPWHEVYDGEHSLVVGHTVRSLREPLVSRRADGREIWHLDTGAVYGGRLTALILETREVVQVQAEAAHHRLKGGAV